MIRGHGYNENCGVESHWIGHESTARNSAGGSSVLREIVGGVVDDQGGLIRSSTRGGERWPLTRVEELCARCWGGHQNSTVAMCGAWGISDCRCASAFLKRRKPAWSLQCCRISAGAAVDKMQAAQGVCVD